MDSDPQLAAQLHSTQYKATLII